MSLSKLIEALNIFLKYQDMPSPTYCSHDKLTVCIDPAIVSEEDKKQLEELGFFSDESEDCFYSFKYGS